MSDTPTMADLHGEIPEVHPLYRDPVHGWKCLRHDGCIAANALRSAEQWHLIFPPSGPTRAMVAQHTYTPACDGIHPPGPCP